LIHFYKRNRPYLNSTHYHNIVTIAQTDTAEDVTEAKMKGSAGVIL